MRTIGRIDYELGHAGRVHQILLDAVPEEDAVDIRDLWRVYDELDKSEKSLSMEQVLDGLSAAGLLERRMIEPTTWVRRPKLLTSRHVAERLGVSLRTVQAWHQEGRLPGQRIGGGLRFLEADVDRMITGGSDASHVISGSEDPILNDLWDNDADAAYDNL